MGSRACVMTPRRPTLLSGPNPSAKEGVGQQGLAVVTQNPRMCRWPSSSRSSVAVVLLCVVWLPSGAAEPWIGGCSALLCCIHALAPADTGHVPHKGGGDCGGNCTFQIDRGIPGLRELLAHQQYTLWTLAGGTTQNPGGSAKFLTAKFTAANLTSRNPSPPPVRLAHEVSSVLTILGWGYGGST